MTGESNLDKLMIGIGILCHIAVYAGVIAVTGYGIVWVAMEITANWSTYGWIVIAAMGLLVLGYAAGHFLVYYEEQLADYIDEYTLFRSEY